MVLRGVLPHIRDTVANDPVLRKEVASKTAMALVGGTHRDHPGPSLVELPGYAQPFDPPPKLANLRQASWNPSLHPRGQSPAQEQPLRAPSRKHAERFIRLADALRSHHDVSRLVDWVMEYVTSETVVIADTGSLLPLLFHLRTARRFGWGLEIASLDEYPFEKVGLIGAIDAIKNRPEIAWRLAAVSLPGASVSHSGSSSAISGKAGRGGGTGFTCLASPLGSSS